MIHILVQDSGTAIDAFGRLRWAGSERHRAGQSEQPMLRRLPPRRYCDFWRRFHKHGSGTDETDWTTAGR